MRYLHYLIFSFSISVLSTYLAITQLYQLEKENIPIPCVLGPDSTFSEAVLRIKSILTQIRICSLYIRAFPDPDPWFLPFPKLLSETSYKDLPSKKRTRESYADPSESRYGSTTLFLRIPDMDPQLCFWEFQTWIRNSVFENSRHGSTTLILRIRVTAWNRIQITSEWTKKIHKNFVKRSSSRKNVYNDGFKIW